MTSINTSDNSDAKPKRTGKRPRTVKTELGIKYEKLIKPAVKK